MDLGTEAPGLGDPSSWTGSFGWLRRALEEWNVISRLREISDQETKVSIRRMVSLFYINDQLHTPRGILAWIGGLLMEG